MKHYDISDHVVKKPLHGITPNSVYVFGTCPKIFSFPIPASIFRGPKIETLKTLRKKQLTFENTEKNKRNNYHERLRRK